MDEIKEDYYSDNSITAEYDYRRFGRGSGALVAKKEEDCIASLVSILGPFENAVAIDCPTGTGRFIPLLQRLGYRVLAADISDSMLKIAKGQGAENYYRASADSVPLEDSSVDLWLMSRFCFHFEDPSRFIKEAARVIRAGGYLLLDCYLWTPRSWVPGKQGYWGGRTFTHNDDMLSGWAKDNGFNIARKQPVFFLAPYIYGFMPLWMTRGVEAISDAIAPNFKTKSYFLLEKQP